MDGSLRGVPVSTVPCWLDPKLPTAVVPTRHDISDSDAKVLVSLSLAAAPSGTGELVISALGYSAGRVTFTVASGQPIRCYTLLLTATGTDGAVSTYPLKLRVDPVLSTDQPQAIPSAGFGTALTWHV